MNIHEIIKNIKEFIDELNPLIKLLIIILLILIIYNFLYLPHYTISNNKEEINN